MTDHEDPDLSALYRRTPRHEPGDTSDTLIRAAAHAAVSRPRRQRQAIVPWAVAATLVLSVGVGWQVFQAPEPGAVFDAAEPMPAPLNEMAPVEDMAPAPAVVAPAPGAAELISGEVAAPALETSRAASPPSRAAEGAARSAPPMTAPHPRAMPPKSLAVEPSRSLSTFSTQQYQPQSARPAGIDAEEGQPEFAAGSTRPALKVCDDPVLDDSATLEQWHAAIETARREQDNTRLDCLHREYLSRFGRRFAPADDADKAPIDQR